VENSEKLAGMLRRRGVKHEILNAKAGQEEREGLIVALAGEKGAVTVSTNMAGRGTDVKLGGNFEFRLRQALAEKDLEAGDLEHLDEIARIRDELREQCDKDEAGVLERGGLYVLGTERHESRRIDNQLRGRSGRQGDVGESRFFLSLQDPLMRRFYKDWVTNAMKRLGMADGVPIESPMVTRAIEKAQKKVEDYYFEIRKNLLEYDEVMDQQRKTIYGVRQEVLENIGLKEKVLEMFRGVVTRQAGTYELDPDGFRGWYHRSFGFDPGEEDARLATTDDEPDFEPAVEAVVARYDEREQELGEELMRKVDRHLLLHTIDTKWMDHLRAITALRQGIGLRGYAQRDPKNEYKAEGFKLFEKLIATVEDEVTSLALRVQVRRPDDEGGEGGASFTRPRSAYQGARPQTQADQEQAARAMAVARMRQQARRPAASAAFDQMRRKQAAPAKAPEPEKPSPASTDEFGRVGRNDPCPCGSGKKYKKCHGRQG